MDCDIIAFQEVFSQDALKELCKNLGFEYFVCVDSPKTRDASSKTYLSTTLALASKYPITKIHELKQKDKSFTFSRKVIKAQIKLSSTQDILVYVAHLKSNRDNEFEYLYTKEDSLEHKKEQRDKSLKEGYSPSFTLRLKEASAIYEDVKASLVLPIVLMCDLNDKEYSLTIDALSNKAYHSKRKNSAYVLYDAYNYFTQEIKNPHPEKNEIIRSATSYYQSKGNVLDYIFISKHFNANNKNHLAVISSYEVHDAHLQKNQNGDLLQSDHAQVVCELNFKNL